MAEAGWVWEFAEISWERERGRKGTTGSGWEIAVKLARIGVKKAVQSSIALVLGIK